MHRMPPLNAEAKVEYLDADIRIIRPGAFVRCGVTGVPILMDDLKYWNAERQEAYADPAAVLMRLRKASKPA